MKESKIGKTKQDNCLKIKHYFFTKRLIKEVSVFKTKNVMSQTRITLIALLMLSFFIGCSKEEPKPDDSITLTQNELTFKTVGGVQTIFLTANTDWKLTPSAEWCKVTPQSGAAGSNIEIKVEVPENTENERELKLTFVAGTAKADLTVKQTESVLTTNKNAITFTPQGGDSLISVTSNANWKVEGTIDWCQITPVQGTEGDTELKITASENTGDAREGKVTIKAGIASVELTLKQDKYSIAASKPELEFSEDAESQKISIEANAAWTVEPVGDWYKIEPEKGEPGTTEVAVSVLSNNSAARNATLTFKAATATATLLITQKAPAFTFGTVEVAGIVWIDRNLNASSTDYKNEWVKTLGAYYQWGRNIPFMDVVDYQKADGPLALADVAIDPSDEGTKDFITVSEAPFIWSKEKKDDLWKGKSPCPKGYRMPTYSDFLTIMPIDYTRGKWGNYPNKALAYPEGLHNAHYFKAAWEKEKKTLWGIKKQGTADAYFLRWVYMNCAPDEDDERYVLELSYWKGNAGASFFADSEETTPKSQAEVEAMFTALGEPVAKMYFPAGSSRAAESGNVPVSFRSGKFWTSDIDPNSTNGNLTYHAEFDGYSVNMNSEYRATGANVRCVRE